MTSSPPNLRAVRAQLLTYLDFHPGDSGHPGDLDPAEAGIVGDPDHIGGYHCGSDRVRRNSAGTINDYSVTESSRDRNGLSDFASADDIGWWQRGEHNLRTYSRWLVKQCEDNTPDSRDIREIIYSPDGRTVKRWDRLSIRSSGDDSHLTHTHRSWFRDAVKSGKDLTALDRRYLTEIGLIGGGMELADKITRESIGGPYTVEALLSQGLIARRLLDGSGIIDGPNTTPESLIKIVKDIRSALTAQNALLITQNEMLQQLIDRPAGGGLSLPEIAGGLRIVPRDVDATD